MTDKELKKLSRAELLEMLIEQSKEVASLKQQLQEANEKLEDKKIKIENAGSIAEAALQLSGVFEAAQKAADLYLGNIKLQEDIPDDTLDNKNVRPGNPPQDKSKIKRNGQQIRRNAILYRKRRRSKP